MRNPLLEMVKLELNQLGMSNVMLIRESYNPQNFGNAEVVYQLGNLQLRFLRDRGDYTVGIGSTSNPQYFYNFDDVAVWMGWISLDDLLKYDTPIKFDEPPPGPIFNLHKALGLIVRDLTQLDRAFASGEIVSTDAKLNEVERNRLDLS